MNPIDIPDTLRLVDHPTARNTVVATQTLPIGSVVFTEAVLTSVLFPDKIGRRCDYCHRSDQTELTLTIRKCTRCETQWYCGEECQIRDWEGSHRLICKRDLNSTISETYATLTYDQMMDWRVLSQLLAKIALGRPEHATSIAIFESLLPSPHVLEMLPAMPTRRVAAPLLSRAHELYQRFPNNNHVIQINLRAIGVAILPLTSRLLNHSCTPNTVLRYILSESQKPRAEVVTIREISEGEEVSIPYLDPAISYPDRQARLKDIYGFDCSCRLCAIQSPMDIHPIGETEVLGLVNRLGPELHRFAFQEEITADFRLPGDQLSVGLPRELEPLLDASVLSALMKRFSFASDQGPFEVAMATGKTVFAIHLCIYPSYYPQIGFHVLEMAKVAWNQYTKENKDEDVETANIYLTIARQILEAYGREGDSGGPLDEADELLELIQAGEHDV